MSKMVHLQELELLSIYSNEEQIAASAVWQLPLSLVYVFMKQTQLNFIYITLYTQQSWSKVLRAHSDNTDL